MTAKHADNKVSRRRALAIGGGVVAGAGAVAAGYDAFAADPTAGTATSSGSGTASASASSGSCVLMSSVTEGPYYLDGALVRENITEGKAGVPLSLRITVQDTTGSCAPVAGAAVEIWHCDAWGYYSGYTTANPGGGAPAEEEDGSTADDRTYLRGYQVADARGVVTFTTIVPGWYTPRTCHIHVKVHTGGEKADGTYEGGKVNFTGQLFFDDATAERVFTLEPYARHTGTYTRIDDDMVYEGNGAASGLLALTPVHKKDPSKGFRGTIVLGIDPDAENTGAGSGGGGGGEPPTGTPPSDAPSAPASSAPSSAPSPRASSASAEASS
ncbi:intradiol ring-cleavage dioxygenase [Streptomyces sp. NPDC059092]|uniref:intradiol ring-cleavage dioxygenase n=1 Tax=Streptomyces sp. NPDC059092 TaxID=3346725 RepID=UPI003677CA21